LGRRPARATAASPARRTKVPDAVAIQKPRLTAGRIHSSILAKGPPVAAARRAAAM